MVPSSSTHPVLPQPSLLASTDNGDGGRESHLPAIIGGSIGAVALVAILGVVVWYLCRRLRQKERQIQEQSMVQPYAHSAYSGYTSEASRKTGGTSSTGVVETRHGPGYQNPILDWSRQTDLASTGGHAAVRNYGGGVI